MVEQEWIEWKDLVKEGFKESLFFRYLKAGLEPYEKYTYEHIDFPTEHHAYTHENNRALQIRNFLKELTTELDDLEKKVEESKSKLFYTKALPWRAYECSLKHKDTKIFSKKIEGKGYPINLETIKKLKICREERTKELSEIQKRMKAIDVDPNVLYWKYFVPSTYKVNEKIKSDLIERAVFKKDDALNIKKNGLEKQSIEDFIKENDATIKKHENVFCRSGDNWLIKYKGKSTTIQNLKGLGYIGYLLDKKDKEINSYDLMEFVGEGGVPKKEDNEISESYKNMSEEQLGEQGLSLRLSGLEFEDFSDKDKEALETTATNVWGDLKKAKEEGHRETIEGKQEEWKKLKCYFLSEFSIKVYNTPKGILYSHMKKPTIDTNRIRTNVKNNLKYAIGKIRDKIPSLAVHFDDYLHTGTECYYSPDPDLHIKWYIHRGD